MKRSLVWRLLRRNISRGQLAGYAIANLAGLAIVLTAMQFYRDVTTVWTGDDSFISRDYLIISKKVGGVGSLLGLSDNSFSASDIADIERQPWARRLGEFTASAFNVTASVDMGGRGLSTALFLESIPSDFFDVSPRGWDYTPGSGEPLPIIISKDYLTLYNFGFAASRGLPQISEAMIGMVPLRVSLSGRGRQQWMDARIVGFSSRLNTIAVPEQFMEWANSTFADQPSPQPSRLIIEVNTPGDPAIERYLADHGYESAGDKVDNGRAAYFLSVATAAVVTVGAVICLLAFFILLLSIYLLLQKNREKVRDLMMLGYRPMDIARQYYIVTGGINLVVMVLAIGAMLCASALWSGPLRDIGVSITSPWPTIVVALTITAVLTAGNFVAIAVNIRRNFPRPRGV